ncbi:MAG: ERCC4 domain-containing protein [Candidatus Sumerlaeota bacterium]|nr:ERCC4 domain-containing protein [Candidatus Sumerlaeota bacterium]
MKPLHLKPTVVIDSREQNPLDIRAFPVVREALPAGDYGVWGHSDLNNPRIIFERKSLDDLIGSLTSGRQRFLREVEVLRRFDFRALVIEASGDQVRAGMFRSQTSPASIIGTLTALQVRGNLHIVWANDHQGAADYVENAVRLYVAGFEKQVRYMAVEITEEGNVDTNQEQPLECLNASGIGCDL